MLGTEPSCQGVNIDWMIDLTLRTLSGKWYNFLDGYPVKAHGIQILPNFIKCFNKTGKLINISKWIYIKVVNHRFILR